MAEFHEHPTYWSNMLAIGEQRVRRGKDTRQEQRALAQIGPYKFYDHLLNRDDYEMAVLGDVAWYLAGRPYYRVFPDYADMFAKTRLDVPASVLQSPWPVFTVRFAKGQELRFRGVALRSFAFGVYDTDTTKNTLNSLHQRVHGKSADIVIQGSENGDDRVAYLHMSMDPFKTTSDEVNDAVSEFRVHSHGFYTVISESESVESLLTAGELVRRKSAAKRPLDANRDEIEAWMTETALRIAMSVCFLAIGGDRLIEPDVLNKDFNAYLAAVNAKNDRAVTLLHKKATEKRDGQIGHTIGRADALLGRRTYDIDTTATHDASGRALTYRHSRQAHFHLYWTGAGRKIPRVKFNRLVVVRPDLPVRPQDVQPRARTPVSRREEANLLTRE